MMALPRGLQYNNQLQFHLKIHSDPWNVMTRFQRPGPIVLEKVGPTSKKPVTQKPKTVSPVKLSDAAEEKLAWALQLARRDLKNMIHQQWASEENVKKQNVVGKKKRGKATKRSVAVNKAPRPAPKQPPRNAFKKSVRTQTPPTKETYYSRRGLLNNLPPGSAQKLQSERWKSPARCRQLEFQEPRGKGRSPLTKEKLSPSSRQAKEIKKLRNELKFYVQRIEKLTKEARGAPSPSRDDEDEKYLLRREVKRAEQTSRSSRLLYSLQQQVRELQEDLGRMGPEKVKHTKRTQILSRLAAAHRGAVRILQAFLHQLPDQVTDQGTLPPIYQELGRLINKLSLCTSHLEVDHNGFPEEVLRIFDKFQTPQRIGTPSPRRQQIPLSPGRNSRRKLEFGKNLLTGRDVIQEKPTVSPLFKEYLPCQPISTERGHGPGQGTAQRIRTDVAKQIATLESPERNAAIKAGLEALMRIDGPETNSGTRPSRPIKPQGKATTSGGRKGVLLPSKPKVFRAQSQKPRQGPRSAGYLQGTNASRLKEQDAHKAIAERAKQDEKAPWAPPGSPRSFHQSPKSPAEKTRAALDEEPEVDGGKPGPPQIRRVLFEDGRVPGQDEGLMQRDGVGWPDTDMGRRWEQERDVQYSGYHGDSRSLDRDAEAMIGQAERAILERIQPLLDKADEVASQQEMWKHPSQHSVQGKLSQKMTEKVTDHAGLIGDLILEDVIGDTAQEMQDIERGREVERIAGGMENASDYETMLQELERMEAEEENIRRRWRKVSYYDPISKSGPGGSSKVPDNKIGMVMGRPLEGELLEWIDEVPVDHTGIQFTTELPSSGRTITIVQPNLSQSPISDEGDESSGDPSLPNRGEDPFNSEPHPDWLKPTGGTIELRVPPDMERDVIKNRKTFDDHLRRKSHLVFGDFDPWKLVTDVSDAMVDGILKDIAEELAECSGGFMDALYRAEFEDAAAVNDNP